MAPCPLAHGTGGEVASSEWPHPTEPGITAQAALMANEIWNVELAAGSVREPGSTGGRPRPTRGMGSHGGWLAKRVWRGVICNHAPLLENFSKEH